jgi:hypothetical protein
MANRRLAARRLRASTDACVSTAQHSSHACLSRTSTVPMQQPRARLWRRRRPQPTAQCAAAH